MILMSKYKGQHGGKNGQKIRARPPPLDFFYVRSSLREALIVFLCCCAFEKGIN